MSAARQEILARIRQTLADVPPGEPISWSWEEAKEDARYRRGRQAEHADVERFAQRLADYGAHVTRTSDEPTQIAQAVAEACSRHGVGTLVAADQAIGSHSPPVVRLLLDDPPGHLATAEIEQAEGVLSGCAWAIAETGSIVLDGGAGQGRRVLSLLPDLLICIVRADQVLPGVPEAIEVLGANLLGHRRPITFVSGPSATADIELTRVQGVHGPRRLEAILAG